jgi:hypothetical protein
MIGGMKLTELKAILREHPSAYPPFILPDGDHVPAHFHITEVGHVTKRFIDCGGKLHDRTDTCLLQTYVADDVDHRMDAGTFAKILDLGAQVLPHDDMPVEIEYDCCVVAQYPIADAALKGEHIEIELGEKHTDCLAKEKCGIDGEGCGSGVKTANEPAGTSCC